MLSTGFIIVALASVALASPLEKRSQTGSSAQPAGFKPLQPASSTETIPLLFALPASDTAGLHAALMDVSDPASPKYGKYLSKQEVKQISSPRGAELTVIPGRVVRGAHVREREGRQRLACRARHHAGSRVSLRRHAARPDPGPSGEHLAQRELHSIRPHGDQHECSGDPRVLSPSGSRGAFVVHLSYGSVRANEASCDCGIQADLNSFRFIPPAIGGPSHTIVESTSLSQATPGKSDAIVPAQCAQFTTPGCLQAIYNIPSTPATAPSNNIYVPAFLNEIATQSDLQVRQSGLTVVTHHS